MKAKFRISFLSLINYLGIGGVINRQKTFFIIIFFCVSSKSCEMWIQSNAFYSKLNSDVNAGQVCIRFDVVFLYIVVIIVITLGRRTSEICRGERRNI